MDGCKWQCRHGQAQGASRIVKYQTVTRRYVSFHRRLQSTALNVNVRPVPLYGNIIRADGRTCEISCHPSSRNRQKPQTYCFSVEELPCHHSSSMLCRAIERWLRDKEYNPGHLESAVPVHKKNETGPRVTFFDENDILEMNGLDLPPIPPPKQDSKSTKVRPDQADLMQHRRHHHQRRVVNIPMTDRKKRAVDIGLVWWADE